jgi:hypothetical protein
VVVHYFDLVRIAVTPNKANAIFVVDAKAVLPVAIAMQFFQPVSRRYRQILQGNRRVDQIQLPQPLSAKFEWQTLAAARGTQFFSLCVPKPSDHKKQ